MGSGNSAWVLWKGSVLSSPLSHLYSLAFFLFGMTYYNFMVKFLIIPQNKVIRPSLRPYLPTVGTRQLLMVTEASVMVLELTFFFFFPNCETYLKILVCVQLGYRFDTHM